MSKDVKLSKAQISKIIQLGGSFGSWLANLEEKKVLTNVAIPLARDNFPGVVSYLTSSTINLTKNSWKRSCLSRERIYCTYFK